MSGKNKRKNPKERKSALAENLRKMAKARSLSSRVLAEMAGTNQSTIVGWMQGVAPTDLEKVAALARGLGVTFSFLCLGVQEPNDLDSLPIEEILEEDETQRFDGIFRLSAVRLVRAKRKTIR